MVYKCYACEKTYIAENSTKCSNCGSIKVVDMDTIRYTEESILGSMNCVAVKGAINDWAVYVGNQGDSPVYVALYGYKMSKKTAEFLFPFEASKYTYRE